MRLSNRVPVSAVFALAIAPWVLGLVMALASMTDAPALPSAIDWHAHGVRVAYVLSLIGAAVLFVMAISTRRMSMLVGSIGLIVLAIAYHAEASVVARARDDLYTLIVGHLREPTYRIDAAFFHRAFSSVGAIAFVPVLLVVGWSIGGRRAGGFVTLGLILSGLVARNVAEDRAMVLLRREVAPPWSEVSPFTPLILGHPATQRPWIVVSRNEPPDLSRGGGAVAVDARLPRSDLARLLVELAGRGLEEVELIGERYRPERLEDPITPVLVDPGINLGGVVIRLEGAVDSSLAASVYCGAVEASPSARFVDLTEAGDDFVLDLAKPPHPWERGGVAYLELGHTVMARDLAIAAQRLREQGLEPIVLVGEARCDLRPPG